MTSTLNRYRWTPFTTVLFLSIAFGFLQSVLGSINFSDAIEHGQVLAGVVKYPIDSPLGLYYSKAYSLSDHISGLWLKAGFSDGYLACFLQVLKGVTLFSGLALCTFALTSKVAWSVLSPIIWYAFGLWGFTDAYPILSIAQGNTNGFLGLVWLALTLGLLANNRRIAGGFALGMLPYVHLSFGVFGWVFGVLWYVVKKSKPTLLSGFMAGALVFVVSYATHRFLFAYPYELPPGLAEYYFHFYTLLFDYHRQPLQATSVHSFILLVIFCLAALYIFLNLKKSDRSEVVLIIPVAIISIILIAFLYSVIASFVGLIALPDIVVTLMPGRLANLVLLLSIPLLFGLASYLPARSATGFAVILTASAFVPQVVSYFALANIGWSESMSIFIWFLALSVALLLANYQVSTQRLVSISFRLGCLVTAFMLAWLAFYVVGIFSSTPWLSVMLSLQMPHFVGFILLVLVFSAFPIILAGCQKWAGYLHSPLFVQFGALLAAGLLFSLTSGLLRSPRPAFFQIPNSAKIVDSPRGLIIPETSYRSMQLIYQQPVLWFMDARSFLPYVPEAGPALEHLLEDVYGWYQLYDPSRWGVSLQAVWEGFGKEDWIRIFDQYAVTSVAAPCGFRLALVQTSYSSDMCFYTLPKMTAANPEKTIPASRLLDDTTIRYFFFPRTIWFPHGWYPLSVDSGRPITHTWAALEKNGKMGIYVPREGDYFLRAMIAPVGDQLVSIKTSGSKTTGPTYLFSAGQHKFESFRFNALHLRAGFNIVDIRAEGPISDVGYGQNASIVFKDVRWETADEVLLAGETGGKYCPPLIPVNAVPLSSNLISGEWFFHGKLTRIGSANSGGAIIVTNENHISASSSIINGRLLWVPLWETYATLSKDGKDLIWDNGNVWTRQIQP